MGTEKVTLKGSETETTHHRMELLAVLESFRFLQEKNWLGYPITVYSDSQYVVGLLQRKERLTTSGYRTKKLTPIRNADLVQSLIRFLETKEVTFVKLKSHLKSSDLENVINREVDMLSRQMMRLSL